MVIWLIPGDQLFRQQKIKIKHQINAILVVLKKSLKLGHSCCQFNQGICERQRRLIGYSVPVYKSAKLKWNKIKMRGYVQLRSQAKTWITSSVGVWVCVFGGAISVYIKQWLHLGQWGDGSFYLWESTGCPSTGD